MSRVRGVFPLFLATTFGIANGVWVFGPVLKEHQLEKDEQARKALEISHQSNDENLRNAEAPASRSATIDSTLKAEGSAASWWPTLGFWSKDAIRKPSNEVPLDEVSEQSNTKNTGSK